MKGTPFSVLLWSFAEFSEVLSEYYYLLTVLPQVLLTFKLRKTQKLLILRIVLLGALAYSKSYLWVSGLHWTEQILLMKEGMIILMQVCYVWCWGCSQQSFSGAKRFKFKFQRKIKKLNKERKNNSQKLNSQKNQKYRNDLNYEYEYFHQRIIDYQSFAEIIYNVFGSD